MRTLRYLYLCWALLIPSQVFAAITFESVVESPETANTATASSVTTATWNLEAGRLVPVCIYTSTSGASINSIADTAGNTYIDSGVTRLDVPVGSGSMWMYYAYNTLAHATNAVTVTFSATVGRPSAIAAEYSGVQTSADPKDVGNTGSATSQTSVTSGAFTPSTAGQVAVACMAMWTVSGNTNVTPDANYAERNEWKETTGGAVINYLEDRLNAPTSSQTASASWTNASWAGMIVRTFKAAVETTTRRRTF